MAATETPPFIITPNSELAEGMAEPEILVFDMPRNKYKEHGHAPLVVGTLEDMAAFSLYKGPIKHNDLVIKNARNDNLSVPAMFEQFRTAIEKIAAYEAAHSKLYHYRRARLTVRQWELPPGGNQDQIKGGWHRDRPGGDPVKTPYEDDIFLISDKDGSLAQARPLRDIFKDLNDLAKPVPGEVVQAQPGQIMYMTNNVKHRSFPSREGGVRTFLRIIFESPEKDILEAIPDSERRRLGLNF